MGSIPSTDNMPSAKFTNPTNGQTLAENTPFTISMAISNLATGNFVNADTNYFSAPQQLNAQGQIVGHSHVVVESLTSLAQITPSNPKVFAFFKGLNDAAQGGILTADVTAGLPAGFYKVSSINTAANHQPVLVPIAQHGSLDDAVYFTVSASGASNSTAAAAPPPAATTAAAAASSSAAAKGTGTGNAGSAASAAASAAAAKAKGNGANANNTQNKAPAAPVKQAPPPAQKQAPPPAQKQAPPAPQKNGNQAQNQNNDNNRGRRFMSRRRL